MKLAVVCPYPVGVAPSQRLKYEQYFESWENAGLEVEVFPFWDRPAWEVLYSRGRLIEKSAAALRGIEGRRRDLDRICEADLVYLHLEAVPLGPPWFERELIASGTPFVYDIDDLVHLPHSSAANPFMRRFRSRRKVTWLMRNAAHVVVCTPYLETFASGFNPAVTDISSTIDLTRYEAREETADRPVVIGWSGSHSTSRYLHLLDDVFRQIAQTENVRFLVIGDAGFEVAGLQMRALAWKASSEVEDLSEIDIGVYPLPDEEWVLGKSGLKALQYMALGIPTVAQSVGANLRIIEHGRNGYLASQAQEWLGCLQMLVRDGALRSRIGSAGRETVAERYSVAANEDRYLRVLASAVGRR